MPEARLEEQLRSSRWQALALESSRCRLCRGSWSIFERCLRHCADAVCAACRREAATSATAWRKGAAAPHAERWCGAAQSADPDDGELIIDRKRNADPSM